MKRSRFTKKQITGILKEQESGLNGSDLCRRHGMSDAGFYKWNTRLKRLLADATLQMRPSRVLAFGSQGLLCGGCIL